MMLHTRGILLVVLAVLVLALAGCSDVAPNPGIVPNNNQEQGNSPQPSSPQPQPTMQLTVYHATRDAMYLVPEIQVVAKNDHPAQTAVELLLNEPTNKDLVQVLPKGTKLLKIQVKDHIAYVDFNNKLVKNNTGGSATEVLIVGAIVNTLTEFPEIQRVQILVEGKKIETISGHMDVSEPLSRSEKIIKKSL